MKRHSVPSILLVLCLSLIGWLAPTAAEGKDGAAQGVWQLGPESLFQYQRHDAVFVPGPDGQPWANKVYYLGGRTSASTELPDIWSFDPVLGSYADTGANMIEDVSNYNGNLVLNDGTGRGPAIYVIGGFDRDNAYDNIGTVQRYYPQTNEIEALATGDDWPVSVSGYKVGGMGSAVVNDIVYVFGGWESNLAPYFSASTWAFDPTQPSGLRWTDLGASLNVPRCYIQSATQAGKLYAMGGIYQYVGGDLVPTTAMEVFDTANPGAGWTALAPMPVAIAEGRGFGFDADTLGFDAPWLGKLYVAGGGDWPDGSAEVMEYDIASDTWDQAFPDLNAFRSNPAGAFIPLCTPDPDDGLPGMWMFGGRWVNGCDPPYAPTEYYAFTCGAENTVHVGGIEGYLTVDPQGRSLLRIHVLAVDQAGIPLSGVSVDASIWAPDGGPYSRSRYTKPSGNARFHWASAASGVWTLCVENMTLENYTYNPDDNVVTCMDWEN